MLPCIHGSSSLTVVPRNGMTSASVASDKQPVKWKRIGKGSHLLPVIRKCFLEPENSTVNKIISILAYIHIHVNRICTLFLILHNLTNALRTSTFPLE